MRRIIRQLARTLARAVGRLFFIVVSLAVVFAGMWLLLRQLVAAEPDAALISAAGALILAGALFARYGEDLAGRLKKVGPIELFEEIRETLSTLEEIAAKVPETFVSEECTVDIQPVPLSAAEKFSFEQADLYTAMLIAMGKEPSVPGLQSKYFALLLKVGGYAFGQNDWPRAAARLGRLEELSGGSYRHEDVAFFLGVAYCYWGMKTTDPAERRRHFAAARARLRSLARADDSRPRTYFFLAFAQDELGDWHEAVRNNEEALKRRPRYALAKYNSAISHLKLDSFQDALRALETLSPWDEQIEKVLASYETDTELTTRMTEFQRRWANKLMQDIKRRRELGETE